MLYVVLLYLVLSVRGDCGDTQHDVESGMIRDFPGIRNCSWTYTAPANRKLLVKVDSVHLPTTSHFQLFVDDIFHDIPRNCVKCLRQMLAGRSLTVVFTSDENETSTGTFQVRYKAFDPHRCPRPEHIENGYVVNKGRKLGQIVYYHCNPPYDLVGDSELTCQLTEESPVPEWSHKTPKCIIQDCTGEPVFRKGSSGAIASPGFPTYMYHFTGPCVWEITSQTSQQIKVSVTYLKFPKHIDNSFIENNSGLSLFDGDTNSSALNLTEAVVHNPVNFTTSSNKLIVQFMAETDSKTKEEVGFYMEYSFVSSFCPKPKSPENGVVIGTSAVVGSTVAYRCEQGFVLMGEMQAECLFNRQWSHPTPSCEAISESLPPSFIASNDSDTLSVDASTLENYPSTQASPSTEDQNHLQLPTTHPNTSSVKESKPLPHVLQDTEKSSTTKKSLTEEKSLTTENSLTNESSETTKKTSSIFPFDESQEVNLMVVYIVAGAVIPLLLIILILGIIYFYRKKYPVRMRFGRKFSTFENPMYVTKDAQHPRELTRILTN